MTDRVRTLVVVLEQDTRVDEAEEYKKIFGAVRGVARVEFGSVTRAEDYFARQALLWEFAKDLREFIHKWVYEKDRKA